jgi:hypothetical protein
MIRINNANLRFEAGVLNQNILLGSEINFIIIIFICMLFLNVYFRVKVFKHYKVLVENRVDISVKDLLDVTKIKNEVAPKYPHLADHIVAFSTNIRNSILIVFGLLILIIIGWAILKYHQ